MNGPFFQPLHWCISSVRNTVAVVALCAPQNSARHPNKASEKRNYEKIIGKSEQNRTRNFNAMPHLPYKQTRRRILSWINRRHNVWKNMKIILQTRLKCECLAFSCFYFHCTMIKTYGYYHNEFGRHTFTSVNKYIVVKLHADPNGVSLQVIQTNEWCVCVWVLACVSDTKSFNNLRLTPFSM